MSSEIEAIRQKKIAEMMQKAGTGSNGGNGWPEEPVVVTDSTFESFLKKYPRVVVDCWAPWCGPCRMLSPTIDALAKNHKDEIAYAKLNTDENPGTAGKFRIVSIPTLLLFKDGKLVDKMIGAAPMAIVEQQVKKSLA